MITLKSNACCFIGKVILLQGDAFRWLNHTPPSAASNAPGCLFLQQISAFPLSRLQAGNTPPATASSLLSSAPAEQAATATCASPQLSPCLDPHTWHARPPSPFEDSFPSPDGTIFEAGNMIRPGQAALYSRRGSKMTWSSPGSGQSKTFGDNQHPLLLTPAPVLHPLPPAIRHSKCPSDN